ncbi:hypothetical protein SAMN04515647_3045 [Cohaesibacter sp. ES.047]|nr:hypothetical protein SAMN04515647_3045 [Cohaesibacter sp. ES.047]
MAAFFFIPNAQTGMLRLFVASVLGDFRLSLRKACQRAIWRDREYLQWLARPRRLSALSANNKRLSKSRCSIALISSGNRCSNPGRSRYRLYSLSPCLNCASTRPRGEGGAIGEGRPSSHGAKERRPELVASIASNLVMPRGYECAARWWIKGTSSMGFGTQKATCPCLKSNNFNAFAAHT